MIKLTRISKSNRGASASINDQDVLYVEDEDVNWEVAEFSLRAKFNLTRARTAEEAFNILRSKRFNLILMDIQLMGSELNGIEITEILRGRYTKIIPDYAEGVTAEDTKIIFVTAYSARYGKEELKASGGDDLMTKPVDFTRLSLVMSRMVARSAYKERDESKEDVSQERRQTVRVDYRMDCQVECAAYVYQGTITNISLGGAQVFLRRLGTGHPLKPGTQCQVTFSTAWGKLAASAKVIEAGASEGELRISFGYIPPASKSILESWLKDSDSES